MKNLLTVCVMLGSAVSVNAFASTLEVEQSRIEQRWYSFSDVMEKRKQYDRVDISRGYIEYYFEGDKYPSNSPAERLSPREKFYANHATVGTYAAADYATALDKACVDVVSNSLGSFRGSYENAKRPDRQQYKRRVVGIKSLSYKGPEYNSKSPASWSPVELPADKRSLLCEIYEVKDKASDVKYIVYAASTATAMFDEIHAAPPLANKPNN